MKKHPIFFYCFAFFVWFFLSGFSGETPKITVHPEATAIHKSKAHYKNRLKPSTEENTAITANKQETALPLDLSVPFKADDNPQNDLEAQPDNSGHNNDNNLFANKPQNATQPPLQLKGGWVMSQEPETEKKKTVDGAGIVINVKQ